MVDRSNQRLIYFNQEWLGFVQPVGLVVAPTVLAHEQLTPDRNVAQRQRDFREFMEESGEGVAVRQRVRDLKELFVSWLDWEDEDFVRADTHRDQLEISLPELNVVLSATWAVPSPVSSETDWLMLIRQEESDSDLDKTPEISEGWNASRHERFERLLRETKIPIGLLCNDECVRLIYAPQGESSGHITFDFSQMAQPAGRPILAAFEMLLSGYRVFVAPDARKLPALLRKSREAQAEVSTRLSQQVLAALYELLRGFVSADARNGSNELTELARRDPDSLYGGLITALMRMVFVLYTEDRGLMSDHPVYQQHYSIVGLFSRLRSDAATWPDTMDQRFGAWAQLLSLFRLIHGGGRHAGLRFVARRGGLFDPDRFPFLEGIRQNDEPQIPMVPDSTVWKVLQNLMMLDGERLSYRTLDVEQIGSVYEAIMGFRVELTTGHSIAVRSPKRTGAAAIVDLDDLLNVDGRQRARLLRDATDQNLTGQAASALRVASEPTDVVALLDRKVDWDATPAILPADVPVLQPTDERRRTGSHYTPRSLTQPIVSEALRPVLERLGADARPEEILELKVLDPATGSGAFLVEACRQLAAQLVDAWSIHGRPSNIPADEDELVQALRLVAQRCLYGVDKNPMAIDLARLSLWLATFARDHEFTFIDHALRHGDSLVGLSRRQIETFHWKEDAQAFQLGAETLKIREHVSRIADLRNLIRECGSSSSEQELSLVLEEVDDELRSVRKFGDIVLSAFFEKDKATARELRRQEYADSVVRDGLNSENASLANMDPPVEPFHWELEFPEVFDRENPGFDVIVGNPPFAGKNSILNSNAVGYLDWLKQVHPESHGNSDLSAHFFRRAFDLLRKDGAFGLIATNTIAQGDTRSTGLRWICNSAGTIYNARRRIKWPGEAAVVVSVVHILKGLFTANKELDGKTVDNITAFLFYGGDNDDPERLVANAEKSFQGSIILGLGFIFDDTDNNGVATPVPEMYRLIAKDPCNQDVIFPYIGGQEVNTSPTHSHHRYVINFGVHSEEFCRQNWPELMNIVGSKVKPERMRQKDKGGRTKWWQYLRPRSELSEAISELVRVLVISRVGQYPSFAFLPTGTVFADRLIVFPFETYAPFSSLQSRTHDIWARFFGSTMKDDLLYTPSDCFETFPFPNDWETNASLETIGQNYYEFRAELMVRNDEGMTKTYNRFHNPDERSMEIVRLRELHAEMDRAVLDAYGWSDIPTDCEFLLDYEIDEEGWGNKKKPYRYRWPDDVRDEVLARLMALNAERAREERIKGLL